MQNNLDLVKRKLQQLQEIIEGRNSEISDNIGQSVNETPDSLTKPLVRDDLLEVTMPLGVVKNRSERRMAELDGNLMDGELQSFVSTDSSITRQPIKELIKVVPPNSWHDPTLNNYNNSNLSEVVTKTNILRTIRDNEMRLRDPSGRYKNFGSWKERMPARVEDIIIKEVFKRNLSEKESWEKISEKKKMMYKLSEKSDYIPRKQVNEILYGDLVGEVVGQQNFSRKGGQRHLATSSENPPSQIPYRYKRSKVKKRRTSPESIRICQSSHGQEILPIWGED
jgi:hypothetical protein